MYFSLVIAIVASMNHCVLAVTPVVLQQSLPQQPSPLDERPTQGHVTGVLHGGLQPLKIDSSIHNIGHVPCLFRIKVPITKPGDVVKIVGSTDSLGNWKTDKALTLKTSKIDFPWYLRQFRFTEYTFAHV